MEIRSREPIRIPEGLYDRAMEVARDRRQTIHDLGQDAVRFWLSVVSEAGEDTRMRITSEEESMVRTFLGFVRSADPDLVSAVSHIVENWRARQRMPRT